MTNLAKQQILRMETQAKFPYLIEITYEGTVYRYANSTEDITFQGNLYRGACFAIEPPERKNGELTDATISISAIDEEWIYKIRDTDKRATIKFLAVIIYSNNSVQSVEAIEEMSFTLTEAEWDRSVISWNMVFDPLAEEQIPVDEGTIFTMPALR